MTDKPKYDVEVCLSMGQDGNTGAIMGAVCHALKKYFRETETPLDEQASELSKYRAETMSGDYNNVIQTAMKWVNVT